MTHPLLYLRQREMANTLRGSVRSPRRLAALGLFGLLMLVFVGEPVLLALGGSASPPRFFRSGDVLSSARVALTGWFVLHTLQWLRAALSDRVLLLPQAHYDVLFPAPISRRALVVNHLAGSYLPFVWGSPLMALPILATAGVWFPGYQPALLLVTVATFLLFDLAAFNLTTLCAVLVRTRTAALSRRDVLVGMGVIVAIPAGMAAWLLRVQGSPRAGLLQAGEALLAPFALLADMALAPLAGPPAATAPVLLAMGALGAATVVLVVDRFAALTEPGREAGGSAGGVRPATWRAGAGFAGERAIVWKTLLALRRGSGRLVLVTLVISGAVALIGNVRATGLLLAAAPAVFLLLYGLLSEPLFAVYSADLERRDLLGPLPMRNWVVLLGSLGPLILTGILAGWVVLGTGLLAFPSGLRPGLLIAFAEVPLLVLLIFLGRALLVTLFPPQRESETLDMIYAAAVEMAVLLLSLVLLAVPSAILIAALVTGVSLPLAWLASVAAALPLLVGLWMGLLAAYRARA